MSDKPIQVGDLVMVVKPTTCCGSIETLGRIKRVIGPPRYPFATCSVCGKSWQHDYSTAVVLDNGKSCERSRLKRIDPDNLKDDIPEREELTA